MIKFLGFVFFLAMFVTGFWGIIYLSHMAIAWIAFGPLETFGKKTWDEEKVRRKNLPEQEGVEVLYTKG